ncbi:type II toxin-antitoxin system PemK/MazF family toxin [Candidatus Harpocratesius sp.]
MSSKGDIVLYDFPFSDHYIGSKVRPCLILSRLPGVNNIMCQITSKIKSGQFKIPIDNTNLSSGFLVNKSVIHYDCLFTGHQKLIKKKIGSLKTKKMNEIIDKVKNLLDHY